VKVAILAGGVGTRLSEETVIKPKPMVEIGGLPILWHIMQIYAAYGHREFMIALGYKGEVIKDYFRHYKRLIEYAGRSEILLTYGDGVADIDIGKLIAFHRAQGRLATVTAVRPPARFGAIKLAEDRVSSFDEKPQVGEGWISGGFFVLRPEVTDYISGDDIVFEKEPMERLARDGQLVAYRHGGFWQCMDTLRDVRLLESLWAGGKAPWKVWS
jgi:glucose-1-phosphate cytidylyltransferase